VSIPPRSRLAVLIDAENIPARLADFLFAAVAERGEPIVRRIYGDFSDPRLSGWHRALARHALTAQQQFTVASGKNAADIALVIDAMDLLHGGTVEGFCLVSGDGDFTRLATRIREHGLDVFGFGGAQAAESFREACRSFTVLDTPPQAALANQPAPGPQTRATPPDPAPLRQAATQLLRRAIQKVPHQNGWRHLSPLGKALRDISPNFDPKHYGHAKLVNLVADTGAFEMTKAAGSVMVRPRPEE
jgi:hypothetical protein